MTPLIAKLLSLMSGPREVRSDAAALAELCDRVTAVSPGAAEALAELLAARNGAQGFEGALTLPPIGHAELGFHAINTVWRLSYGALAANCLVFGWSGFGDASVLTPKGTGWFDAETGEIELTGPSLDSWAADLLVDYEMRTGHPLVRAWQARHGRLAPGHVLAPLQPFVLGGAFAVDNLRALPLTERFHQGGRLARAIAGRPDGAPLAWPLADTEDGASAG